MATTTKIHVTGSDNELYLIASTPNSSSEICHLKSGNNNPVDYTVIPQSILPKGNYTLIIVGINWGGPTGFKVTLTTGNTDTPYVSPSQVNPPAGVTWTQSIQMTV